MAERYTLGDAFANDPAHCFIQDNHHPSYPLVVLGYNQQEAQSKAARLVDLLNDPGMPFYLEVIEPTKPAKIIPIRGRR